MLPALTALMISSSLVKSVPPWNSIASSPFERSVTSLAIAANATAEDSGSGVTCAKISFLGLAWAKAGALARPRMPAAPAACRTRRRVVGAMTVTGDLPNVVFSAWRHYSSRKPGDNDGDPCGRALIGPR